MHYIWLSMSDNRLPNQEVKVTCIEHLKLRGLVLLRPDLGPERRGSLEAPVVRSWHGTCATFPCTQDLAARTAQM